MMTRIPGHLVAAILLCGCGGSGTGGDAVADHLADEPASDPSAEDSPSVDPAGEEVVPGECGDGDLGGAEQCDDGDLDDCNGCSA
ncbi:MAG: DUF4215 domain-containing protein, partial [Deltaproteobacteria bacterium]|nr:DUF4215 domain-containing protein [Deltaproteobacteria bacterium]